MKIRSAGSIDNSADGLEGFCTGASDLQGFDIKAPICSRFDEESNAAEIAGNLDDGIRVPGIKLTGILNGIELGARRGMVGAGRHGSRIICVGLFVVALSCIGAIGAERFGVGVLDSKVPMAGACIAATGAGRLGVGVLDDRAPLAGACITATGTGRRDVGVLVSWDPVAGDVVRS